METLIPPGKVPGYGVITSYTIDGVMTTLETPLQVVEGDQVRLRNGIVEVIHPGPSTLLPSTTEIPLREEIRDALIAAWKDGHEYGDRLPSWQEKQLSADFADQQLECLEELMPEWLKRQKAPTEMHFKETLGALADDKFPHERSDSDG